MAKVFFYITLYMLTVTGLYAQHKKQSFFLGPGFGLDHGGTGLKAEYQPLKFIGLFLGGGFDWVGVSGNIGAIYNVLPDKKVSPVVTAMAGVNGVIITDYSVPGDRAIWASKTQYGGVTLGVGADLKFGRQRNQKASLNILVPIRNEDFRNKTRALQARREPMQIKPRSVLVAVGWSVDLFNFRPKTR